jgi:branched-chain amino acid transport system ATP-binding protein
VLKVAGRGYLLETGRIKLAGSSAELLASDAIKKAYLGL